jgi:hypothetical protein
MLTTSIYLQITWIKKLFLNDFYILCNRLCRCTNFCLIYETYNIIQMRSLWWHQSNLNISLFILTALTMAKSGATLEEIHQQAAEEETQKDAQKLAQKELKREAKAAAQAEQERVNANKGKVIFHCAW